LGQIPGKPVNNSQFLVATHVAVVLYVEIGVVNNSPALRAYDGLGGQSIALSYFRRVEFPKNVRADLASQL
jgi:hypothetical protein